MSQENIAGLAAGDIPEDFSAYEQFRHTGKLPEAETETSEEKPPVEADTEIAGDDTDSPDDTEPKKEDGDGGEPKKKSGSQRAREKAERLARENEELRQRLAAAEGKQSADPSAGKPEAAKAGKPQLSEFLAKHDDYNSAHEAYTEALIEYQSDLREQERASKEQARKAKEAEETVLTAWEKRQNEFKSKTADYDDVLEDVADVQLSDAFGRALIESEAGPKLAYELSKDRAELERIAKLSPLAQVRELGKLEARFTSEPTPKPKPKVSAAPDPIKPVGPRSGVDKKPLTEVDDFSEYEKRRKAGDRR